MEPSRRVVRTLAVLAVGALAAGCGGGLAKSDAPVDNTPPRVTGGVLYTGSVERIAMAPTDKLVPVVHPTTTLSISVTLKDAGGFDRAKPPTIALFPTNGGRFGSGAFVPMSPQTDVAGGWQIALDFADLDMAANHPSAYVTAILRATDKAGNELVQPAGTFYYSNP